MRASSLTSHAGRVPARDAAGSEPGQIGECWGWLLAAVLGALGMGVLTGMLHVSGPPANPPASLDSGSPAQRAQGGRTPTLPDSGLGSGCASPHRRLHGRAAATSVRRLERRGPRTDQISAAAGHASANQGRSPPEKNSTCAPIAPLRHAGDGWRVSCDCCDGKLACARAALFALVAETGVVENLKNDFGGRHSIRTSRCDGSRCEGFYGRLAARHRSLQPRCCQ